MPVPDTIPVTEAEPRTVVLALLDWYRAALLRKTEGLSDGQLRAPVEPMGWSPIGLVNHLAGVERRWLRWGFLAEDVVSWADDEWTPAASTAEVLAAYEAQVARSREAVADHPLETPSRIGGRFSDPAEAPPLGRILFHLLQEYARHVGHLDVARELIDGVTGE
ncbi:MAG TPA: DinB family protein [Frankiaceae bacterium]|nr:DinB family protein [Frankiaceae bacterium]